MLGNTIMKKYLVILAVVLVGFGAGVWCGAKWAARVTIQAERLDDCVESARYVRALTLLRASNAQQIDSNLYAGVIYDMENQIDWHLAGANEYLSNRSRFVWQLYDKYYGPAHDLFARDLPSVVKYRDVHSPVWDHGPHDRVMDTYRKVAEAPSADALAL